MLALATVLRTGGGWLNSRISASTLVGRELSSPRLDKQGEAVQCGDQAGELQREAAWAHVLPPRFLAVGPQASHTSTVAFSEMGN